MKKAVRQFLFCFFSIVRKDSAPKTVFYHDIGMGLTPMGTPVETFWRHMCFLRPGDQVCFDDGFRGVWDDRERFKITGIKPIVFLAVGLVGREGYLTWDEARQLQNEYGFDFQCHTWSHQTLAGPFNPEVPEPEEGRTEDWFHHELVDSKTELEAKLGKKVSSLCFPVGFFSRRVVRRCREVGYKYVYASYPGNRSNGFIQSRCLVQDLSPITFKAVLNGGMNVFKSRYVRMHEILEES